MFVGTYTGAATVENSMEISEKKKKKKQLKLKIELPYDPVIPLLGVYLKKKKKTLIQKDTSTSMFITALYTIAKIWKQPNCPPTDEWIKKMWYT